MGNIGGILLDEQPLVVVPKLAQMIGLNEAIIVQQIHYWIQKSTELHDDKKWVYNSVKEWQEQFCFMGEKTIRRVLDSLIRQGIVVKGNYNKKKFDRTAWYTIDYNRLDAIAQTGNSSCPNGQMHVDKLTKCKWTNCPNACGQIDQMDVDKLTEPIPETTRDYQRLQTESVYTPLPKKANAQVENGSVEKGIDFAELLEHCKNTVPNIYNRSLTRTNWEYMLAQEIHGNELTLADTKALVDHARDTWIERKNDMKLCDLIWLVRNKKRVLDAEVNQPIQGHVEQHQTQGRDKVLESLGIEELG